MPDDLPTEDRLTLNDLLVDGTYLRLTLFLGSDDDKAEVERELAAFEFEEEAMEEDDLPAPLPY